MKFLWDVDTSLKKLSLRNIKFLTQDHRASQRQGHWLRYFLAFLMWFSWKDEIMKWRKDYPEDLINELESSDQVVRVN